VSHNRRPYTSDVRNGQWKRMAWLFPKGMGAARRMESSLREIFNAILYMMVTGCQWYNLPTDLPNPKSVCYHFRKWVGMALGIGCIERWAFWDGGGWDAFPAPAPAFSIVKV